MVQRVAALRVGDPDDATTTVGPLKLGKAAVAGLQAQVRDAVTKGAKVIAGYGAPASAPGAIGAAAGAKHEAIMVPTVVVDCTHDMTIVQQESFGPVVALLCVGSDAEAIALMNDSHLGLTGGVFTASAAAAEAVLSQLQVPMYWLCCVQLLALHPVTHTHTCSLARLEPRTGTSLASSRPPCRGVGASRVVWAIPWALACVPT